MCGAGRPRALRPWRPCNGMLERRPPFLHRRRSRGVGRSLRPRTSASPSPGATPTDPAGAPAPGTPGHGPASVRPRPTPVSRSQLWSTHRSTLSQSACHCPLWTKLLWPGMMLARCWPIRVRFRQDPLVSCEYKRFQMSWPGFGHVGQSRRALERCQLPSARNSPNWARHGSKGGDVDRCCSDFDQFGKDSDGHGTAKSSLFRSCLRLLRGETPMDHTKAMGQTPAACLHSDTCQHTRMQLRVAGPSR